MTLESEFRDKIASEDEQRASRITATYRTLARRFSVLVWSVLHVRTIVRRVIAAVYSADEAKTRIIELEGVVEGLEAGIKGPEGLEADIKGLEAGIKGLESSVRGMKDPADRMKTHIIRLEEAAEETAADIVTLKNGAGGARGRITQVDGLVRGLIIHQRELSRKLESLDEQLASVHPQIHELAQQAVMVKQEMTFQRRLIQLVSPPNAVSANGGSSAIIDRRFDSLCAALIDAFGVTQQETKEHLLPFVERLILAGAGSQIDQPIVDIGCGRGEWLEVLGERGLYVYGIDINSVLVGRGVARGLDIRHADLVVHLRGLKDASRSALTAFHVIEHLPFATMIDFLDEALRVLIPGGVLIVETSCPSMTHCLTLASGPIAPAALRLILEHRGFSEFDNIQLPSPPKGQDEGESVKTAQSNRASANQSGYAIIARRVR